VKIKKGLPIVLSKKEGKAEGFPVGHYSYSMFTLACTNPTMFKIKYINGDVIDTTSSPASVLGSAVHKGIETYLGGNKDVPTPVDEGEAIKLGHEIGLQYLRAYSDGFITWSSTIPNRQLLEEKYAHCYFGYIKDFQYKKRCKEVLMVEKMLKYRVEVEGQNLPIPLKGQPDFVFRGHDDKIHIEDHKVTGAFSKEDDIDASKLIQAAFMYFLVYAETGEAPYDITFNEYKHTENRDKSSQTRRYNIVFGQEPMLFELFYRMYQDITDMLLGKAVFLPNIRAMFDKEVTILSYIYRLDHEEERNKAFERMKVTNITDFLKEKIQKETSIKKYMETVQAQFISSATLNYKDMTIEERIKMKMAEHGLGLEFHSKVEGYSVDLYRYEPSIGLKMSKIESYVKDVEQVVSVSGVRVLAPIPNSELIGFEVPRAERRFPEGKAQNDGFDITVGVNTMGETVKMDIREAPHVIVAGSTGSGKSVWLDSLIGQISTVLNTELILLDPKFVELSTWKEKASVYADNGEDIALALNELVVLMNSRYKVLQEKKLKNMQGTDMPYIFVIFDEYGDAVSGTTGFEDNIKSSILLLVQKARAAGIHIILTTQRPSVKIISGEIKANCPCRIAFRCSSSIDSQVILDQGGAEKLLGKGDMLALLPGQSSLVRLQGYSS